MHTNFIINYNNATANDIESSSSVDESLEVELELVEVETEEESL